MPVFNQPTQLSISLVRLNGPDDNLSICWNVTDAKGNSYVFETAICQEKLWKATAIRLFPTCPIGF